MLEVTDITAYEILGLVFTAVLVRATIIEDNRHQLQQSLPTMSLFTWNVAKHRLPSFREPVLY